MVSRAVLVLVTVLCVALFLSRKWKHEGFNEKWDGGGMGGGLKNTRKRSKQELYFRRKVHSFASRFYKHMRSTYNNDPRAASLFASWEGKVSIGLNKGLFSYSPQKKLLGVGIPGWAMTNPKGEPQFPQFRMLMLKVLASAATGSKGLDAIKGTWGFYLRVATEELGMRVQLPRCIIEERCDRYMCPKCEWPESMPTIRRK